MQNTEAAYMAGGDFDVRGVLESVLHQVAVVHDFLSQHIETETHRGTETQRDTHAPQTNLAQHNFATQINNSALEVIIWLVEGAAEQERGHALVELAHLVGHVQQHALVNLPQV